MEIVPPDFNSETGPPWAVRLFHLDPLLNFCRSDSLWPFTFGLACCAIEMMATGAARFDIERFGYGVFRASPRQADLMIVSGTVSRKMAACIKTLYDQMAAPKYVIAHGGCAISGGPFKYPGQHTILEGIDKIIPVDVYVPGCPPRPEALLAGMLKLRDQVRAGVRVTTQPPAPPVDFQAARLPLYKDAVSRADFRQAVTGA